jgi:hypothetical protein
MSQDASSHFEQPELALVFSGAEAAQVTANPEIVAILGEIANARYPRELRGGVHGVRLVRAAYAAARAGHEFDTDAVATEADHQRQVLTASSNSLTIPVSPREPEDSETWTPHKALEAVRPDAWPDVRSRQYKD